MTPQRSLLSLALALLGALLLAACGGSSSGSAKKSKTNKKSSAPKNTSGRAGTTPDTPAPSLTQADLNAFQAKVDEAKTLLNAAELARRGDDQATFKSKGKAAQRVLEMASELISEQLDWHSEADMGGWAMPAEYVRLESYFAKYSKLVKQARMIGS